MQKNITLSAVVLDNMTSSTVELYSGAHSCLGANFTAIARAMLRPWRTIQSTPDTSAVRDFTSINTNI